MTDKRRAELLATYREGRQWLADGVGLLRGVLDVAGYDDTTVASMSVPTAAAFVDSPRTREELAIMLAVAFTELARMKEFAT